MMVLMRPPARWGKPEVKCQPLPRLEVNRKSWLGGCSLADQRPGRRSPCYGLCQRCGRWRGGLLVLPLPVMAWCLRRCSGRESKTRRCCWPVNWQGRRLFGVEDPVRSDQQHASSAARLRQWNLRAGLVAVAWAVAAFSIDQALIAGTGWPGPPWRGMSMAVMPARRSKISGAAEAARPGGDPRARCTSFALYGIDDPFPPSSVASRIQNTRQGGSIALDYVFCLTPEPDSPSRKACFVDTIYDQLTKRRLISQRHINM